MKIYGHDASIDCICTYIYHKHQLDVGKYTIHEWYGYAIDGLASHHSRSVKPDVMFVFQTAMARNSVFKHPQVRLLLPRSPQKGDRSSHQPQTIRMESPQNALNYLNSGLGIIVRCQVRLDQVTRKTKTSSQNDDTPWTVEMKASCSQHQPLRFGFENEFIPRKLFLASVIFTKNFVRYLFKWRVSERTLIAGYLGGWETSRIHKPYPYSLYR